MRAIDDNNDVNVDNETQNIQALEDDDDVERWRWRGQGSVCGKCL